MTLVKTDLRQLTMFKNSISALFSVMNILSNGPCSLMSAKNVFLAKQKVNTSSRKISFWWSILEVIWQAFVMPLVIALSVDFPAKFFLLLTSGSFFQLFRISNHVFFPDVKMNILSERKPCKIQLLKHFFLALQCLRLSSFATTE